MDRTTLTRRALMAAGMMAMGAQARAASESRIRFSFAGHRLTATLPDTATNRDLLSRLPLRLTIEDYGNNEKIVYLPRKLDVGATAPFANEAPGDLCYYAPWGNLVLFYAGYTYSPGLFRLGRMQDWAQPLAMRGKFPVEIERV